VTGKRKKGRPVGETIGGIIVGFDQQIFRTTPPVHELIAKAKAVRTVSGQGGGEFEVVFPDDGVEAPLATPTEAGEEPPIAPSEDRSPRSTR
jgi:hypothetical protein